MKPFFTLVVFLLTACLYAQTPTSVLEEIEYLAEPIVFYGDDLYYVSNNLHIYKTDVTESNAAAEAVVSLPNDENSAIYDLALHGDVLYISVYDLVGSDSEISKVDLTANPLIIEEVISLNAASSPIAFLGNDLYFITNELLAKIDITDPTPAIQVVMTTLPDDSIADDYSNFFFYNSTLYMGTRHSSRSIYRVDVTAISPVAEKLLEGGEGVNGLAIWGNSLYYDLGGTSILRIQDVNSGTKGGENVVTGIDLTGGLAIHNNYLYISDTGANKILKYKLSPFEGIYRPQQPLVFKGDDLYYVSDHDHIYKITDVTAENPVVEAVVSFPNELVSEGSTNFSIQGFAFYGDDTLYVSESDNDTGERILKVDLTTDPPTIEEVFFTDNLVFTPIAILGDNLYFASTTDYTVNSLSKLDLTVPTPTAEEVLALPIENFSNFIFDGNLLYMSSSFDPGNTTGVHRVDVTAENPVFEEIAIGDVFGVAIDDNSLYYSLNDAIQRIQDVNSGTQLGKIIDTGIENVYQAELAVHNNYLYILEGDFLEATKIVKHSLTPFEGIYSLGKPLAVHGDDLYYVSASNHIYKITDVTAENPVVEAVVSFPNEEESGNNNYSFTSIAFHGGMLYVSEANITNRDKISRIDITTDPPSVEELYQTDVYSFTPIAFLGDYIYFVNVNADDGSNQLLKMDVTAQALAAEVVMMLPEEGVSSDMAFHGNDLYMAPASSHGSSYRVDVTAETPMIEELSDLASGIQRLVFRGNSLYYSKGTNSVDVALDVNSETIQIVDVETEGLDRAFGLAIHDNHLYVADIGTNKILAFELPTIWSGADLTFTKDSGADWTQEANQDRLTDHVWITRQDSKPMYNYKWWQDTFGTDATVGDLQYDFRGNGDPAQSFTATGGTKRLRWAILDDTGASTNNWESFGLYGTLGSPTNFYSFNNMATMIGRLEGEDEVTINSVVDDLNVNITDAGGTSFNVIGPNSNFPSIVGKKLGVWIEEENIYFTLTFNSWDNGDNSGEGGFSYTRSTVDSTLDIDTPLPTQSRVILLPNPVRNQLQLFGLSGSQQYTIYNLLGVASGQGTIANGGSVTVSDLPKGLYFLKLEGVQTLKFIKE